MGVICFVSLILTIFATHFLFIISKQVAKFGIRSYLIDGVITKNFVFEQYVVWVVICLVSTMLRIFTFHFLSIISKYFTKFDVLIDIAVS